MPTVPSSATAIDATTRAVTRRAYFIVSEDESDAVTLGRSFGLWARPGSGRRPVRGWIVFAAGAGFIGSRKIDRDLLRDFAGGGPLGAALVSGDEAGAVQRRQVVAHGG